MEEMRRWGDGGMGRVSNWISTNSAPPVLERFV